MRKAPRPGSSRPPKPDRGEEKLANEHAFDAVHSSYNGEVGHRRTMSSAQAGKTMTRRGEWTINVRAALGFAAVCVLIAALSAFMHRGSRATEWPLVQGVIRQTRIVADRAVQTKWGGQVTWRADYKVAYVVATHEYVVWTDSLIRGQSEDDVRLALPKIRAACRVRYNPRKPEVSVADCR